MSKSPRRRQGAGRQLTTLIRSAAVVVMVLLVFVSVFAVALLKSGDSQKARLLSAGQLQADARTLVAALSFLFDDSVSSSPQVPRDSAALCASNINLPPLPSAALCCLSNQSELFSELMTNVPARS